MGKGSCFRVRIPLPMASGEGLSLDSSAALPKAKPAEVVRGGSENGAAHENGKPCMWRSVIVNRRVACIAWRSAGCATLGDSRGGGQCAANTEILVSILGEEGFETVTAENGKRAVRDLRRIAGGVFFSRAHGHANARDATAMRQRAPSAPFRGPMPQEVRIFACTASTFAEDRARALEAGMDDFLGKPLNVPVMLQKLNALGREGRHG